MANKSTYVIRLAAWLGEALGASAPLFDDFSTAALGVNLPPAVLQAAPVKSALKQASDGAKAVHDAGTNLDTVAGGGGDLQILGAFIGYGTALVQLFTALESLANAVHAAVTPASVPDAAARAAAAQFAQISPRR